MPTFETLRKRIKTVSNTEKITKAMKMIAAVKLRKLQQQADNSRAYANNIEEIVREITAKIDTTLHPLMRKPTKINKTLIVLMSSDRGLCGGYNSNVNRLALQALKEAKDNNTELEFISIGKNGRDMLRRSGAKINLDLSGSSGNPNYSEVRDISSICINGFANGEYDEVSLIYNRFMSVLSQKPVEEILLPLSRIVVEQSEAEILDPKMIIYEPSLQEILKSLLPRMIESRIYHALLESAASEHAARMTAMDSATNNAKDMIQTLTLVMNKARQSTITKELMDIVNGAEAMR